MTEVAPLTDALVGAIRNRLPELRLLTDEVDRESYRRDETAYLKTGLPCAVIVQQFQPLGMTNAAGVALYAFALTVIPATGNPYQVQVGNPVPNEAIALCYPGSRLPAKVKADNPEGIVIDWEKGNLIGGSDPRKDGCAIGY